MLFLAMDACFRPLRHVLHSVNVFLETPKRKQCDGLLYKRRKTG